MWTQFDTNNPDHFDAEKYEVIPGSVKDHVIEVLKCVDEEDAMVKIAAFFHDCGKPSTFKNVEGKVSFIGHDKVGGDVFDEIADKMKISNSEREEIQSVVKTHMRMHLFMEMSKSKCFDIVDSKHWETIYKVSKADDKSRLMNYDESHWEAVDSKVKDIKTMVANKAAVNSVVNGNIVMNITGAKGKRIGEIITKTKAYIINKGIDVTTDEGKNQVEQYIKSFKG
jgi:poly(A) polymerase